MADFEPFDLLKSMKMDTLHVHAPSDVIFLCGGATGPDSDPPATLRDAFLRSTQSGVLSAAEIMLAEKAEPLTTTAGYKDLLSFEQDIAQVVALILLFSESAGSLAELGAFAALPSVSPSLLVVMDDYYYSKSSFVRNGPIKFLEHTHGDEWVLVLDRKDLGIDSNGGLSGLDMKAFVASLLKEIEKRLAARKKLIRFDPTNPGHVILLIVGLCQDFGALTLSEIKSCLIQLGVNWINDPRLDNLVYCATLFDWVVKTKKGNHSFFIARNIDDSIDYNYVKNSVTNKRVRWRSDILEHWSKKDRPRFLGIQEVRSPGPRAS